MAPHRRTRNTSDLQRLSISLNKVINAKRMQRLTGVAILRRHWHDVVGTMLAERSEPIAIEPQADGTLALVIAVDHSVFANMIHHDMHHDIRIACFKRCKLQGLTKVWTRIQPGAGIRESQKVKIQQHISCRELRILAESLQDVEDKALRRQMFQAATAQIKNKVHT